MLHEAHLRVLVPETFAGVVDHVSNRDVDQSRANLVEALVVVAHASAILLLEVLEIMVIAWARVHMLSKLSMNFLESVCQSLMESLRRCSSQVSGVMSSAIEK